MLPDEYEELKKYSPEDLVTIFELTTQEILFMILKECPEKYNENIYKVLGE
jgi:hypothetical protein